MIDGFDIRTLTVIITLLATIHGIGLCFYAKTHSSFHGFWKISSGFLLFALCFLLISFRTYISNWIAIIFSGFFVVYSIQLIGSGVLCFFNFPFKQYQKICYLLLFTQLLTFIYYSIFDFNPEWRISIICCIFSIQCFYLSYKLFQIKDKQHNLSIRLLYSLFIFYGLVFIGRAIWSQLYYDTASPQAISIAHISSLLTFMLMLVLTSSTIIWSASDRLQAELKRQATIDPLTKIYNRRALESHAQNEIARSQRTQHCLSVIIIDIDLFKNINDTYGHQFGDQVLEKFCALISENLRTYDVFARYGGEEFVVLMPNTRTEDAIKISEKLRGIINKANFNTLTTKTEGPITASFGVTESDIKDISWGQLISEADTALYQAKLQGRNRVVDFKALRQEEVSLI